MAIDFPSSPTTGQKHQGYTWDGTRWAMFGSGGGDGLIITDWTAVTFQNSWVNYGGGWQTAQYRKVGDTVELRGLVASGSVAVPMFTLPVGFRPPSGNGHIFRQECSTYKGCRVDVQGDGDVIVSGYDAGGTNSYVSLEGISFSTTVSGGATVIGGTGPGPGIVAYAQRTTNSATFTASSADIPNMSVTFNALPNRRYRCSVELEVFQATASDVWVIGINEGTTVLRRLTGNNAQASASNSYHVEYMNTTSISGSKTWKVTALQAVNTGAYIVAGAGLGNHYTAPPAYIMVEDIGPL